MEPTHGHLWTGCPDCRGEKIRRPDYTGCPDFRVGVPLHKTMSTYVTPMRVSVFPPIICVFHSESGSVHPHSLYNSALRKLVWLCVSYTTTYGSRKP